jgi:uncharacterized membrane protein YqjE
MADEGGPPGSSLPPEPGLTQLLKQFFGEAETLLLQELALVRAELGENAGKLLGGILVLLAGVAVASIGGLALMAALILLLGLVMPLWLAAAVVGVVVAAVGIALVLYGKRLVARASLLPRRSWQSLRETSEWLREELT